MEMNCFLMGSLKRIALIRIAIVLWSREETHDLILKFHSSTTSLNATRILYNQSVHKKWGHVVNQIIKASYTLSIPELLKDQMPGFVKAVGSQIFMWIMYHENTFTSCCTRKNLTKLCWTPRGTIDKKRTAEQLVRDGNLEIALRYKLACTYCLEDYIRTLWEQISGRELFRKNLAIIRMKEANLVSFWCHYVEGKTRDLEDMIKYCNEDCAVPYEFMFKYSTYSGNEEATKFFFQKITEERRDNLERIAGMVAEHRNCSNIQITDFPKGNYTDVLYFLLSNMNEDQQIQTFKMYSDSILKCLLDWPWHCLFIETAKIMTSVCAKVDYYGILSAIVEKVRGGHTDYDYQTLLGEFWQQAPLCDKRYVMQRCTKERLLLKLFEIEDRKNIQLILKDSFPAESEKIISSDVGKSICESLMFQNKCDLLLFFVRQCLLSKDVLVRFKNEFSPRIVRHRSENTPEKQSKWDKFFQLLDDLIQSSCKKRELEVDSPDKKHVRRLKQNNSFRDS